MVLIKFTQNFNSLVVNPSRMFRGLQTDANNLLPQLAPNAIRSMEYIEGNGGPRSIRSVNFQGGPPTYMRLKIDECDAQNYTSKMTVLENDLFSDNIKLVVVESIFEARGGGCVGTIAYQIHTDGNTMLTEEAIEGIQARVTNMFNIVERYLRENPNVYA